MSEEALMIRISVTEGSATEGVGARLKRLRLQRGLSQRDLSSPGVSYAYISRIEAALADAAARPPHLRTDLYTTLGQSYAALGAPDRAVRVFEDCLERVRDAVPDDKTVEIRYATFLSYALTDAAQYERAATVVRQALDNADEHTDPY